MQTSPPVCGPRFPLFPLRFRWLWPPRFRSCCLSFGVTPRKPPPRPVSRDSALFYSGTCGSISGSCVFSLSLSWCVDGARRPGSGPSARGPPALPAPRVHLCLRPHKLSHPFLSTARFPFQCSWFPPRCQAPIWVSLYLGHGSRWEMCFPEAGVLRSRCGGSLATYRVLGRPLALSLAFVISTEEGRVSALVRGF